MVKEVKLYQCSLHSRHSRCNPSESEIIHKPFRSTIKEEVEKHEVHHKERKRSQDAREEVLREMEKERNKYWDFVNWPGSATIGAILIFAGLIVPVSLAHSPAGLSESTAKFFFYFVMIPGGLMIIWGFVWCVWSESRLEKKVKVRLAAGRV